MRIRRRTDADRVRGGCGRASGTEAEEIAVVPCRDDRHDAGADDIRDRFDEDVRSGIRLGAAAREVDDVHAVAHGCFERGHDLGAVRRAAATERGRSRDVEDPVVADVGARRDSLEVVDCGMAATLRLDADARTPGLDVGLDARNDACDMGAVERVVAIERRAARSGSREAAGRDHLRRSRARAPFREAGWIREPRRVEELVLVVDAVVDDGHLDAVTSRTCQPGERKRPEHRRPAVQAERVRVARIDAVRGLDLEEVRQPLVRHAHREAVHKYLVAPRDLRLRDLPSNARDCPRLRRLQPAEVRARE